MAFPYLLLQSSTIVFISSHLRAEGSCNLPLRNGDVLFWSFRCAALEFVHRKNEISSKTFALGRGGVNRAFMKLWLRENKDGVAPRTETLQAPTENATEWYTKMFTRS